MKTDLILFCLAISVSSASRAEDAQQAALTRYMASINYQFDKSSCEYFGKDANYLMCLAEYKADDGAVKSLLISQKWRLVYEGDIVEWWVFHTGRTLRFKKGSDELIFDFYKTANRTDDVTLRRPFWAAGGP
jgi:hypothetical protein